MSSAPTTGNTRNQDETQNGTIRHQQQQQERSTTATIQIVSSTENGASNGNLSNKLDGKPPEQPEVQLSDFIGEHGFYQLALSVLLFVRYVLLGLMANSGPLMTPDVTFYCHLPMQEILFIMPNISTLSPREQELEIKEEFKQVCQIDLHLYQNQSQLVSNSSKLLPGQSFKTSPISSSSLVKVPAANQSLSSTQHAAINNTLQQQQQQPPAIDYNLQRPPSRIRECTEFTYQLAPSQGRSVTSEFNLVCDDDWLRSLFQSLLSAAIVVAHVFWGTFSDKYGRFQAQRICLVVSLVAGTLSIFAWDFWSFTLLRALCSFGDLGLVVSMTTTMVELVGSKYRGLSVALVNFGYALGVSLLPYLVAYCQDFRLMVGITVLCHMVSMPFVLATNESIRWLLTNRKHEPARRELKRIMRWNHNCSEIWPSSCQWLVSCFLLSSAESPEKKQDEQQQQRQNRSGHRNRPRGGALLEQKRQFQLKFERFIKQLECQNLCDPNTSETSSEQAKECPAHPQSPRQVRHHHERSPTPPVSRFEPLLRPEPSKAAEEQADNQTSDASTTVAEVHPEVKPRLLDMMDLEHLQLIKEVESAGSEQAAEPLPGTRRLLGQVGRSLTLSRGGLLEDLTIKSIRMEHNALNSRWSLPAIHEEQSWAEFRSRHDYIRQRQQQQQCQPDCINMFAHQLSFVGRVSRLFKDKKLMIATFTIVWTTFNSELLYTSFIIINLYAGEDVYLNYVIGGCAEALAAIVASLLLSYSPRRLSLIAFWLLISFSCFGLSLAHIDNIWAVWLLALAKFSQSCLSSIASVAAYESFPTFLRQSGSGLVFTLGMMGSVFAPLIFAEFDDHAGMDRVLIIFSISSLTAALLIYMFLKETRDCELM